MTVSLTLLFHLVADVFPVVPQQHLPTPAAAPSAVCYGELQLWDSGAGRNNKFLSLPLFVLVQFSVCFQSFSHEYFHSLLFPFPVLLYVKCSNPKLQSDSVNLKTFSF